MTASDLINIFLRLEMGGKASESELVFDSGAEGMSPFSITGIHLDEDGDICLESDQRLSHILSPKEIADAVSSFDGNRTVYFVTIDGKGESELYNIKDGGTKDRLDKSLQIIRSKELLQCLGQYSPDVLLHFESGTINFTVNSVYADEYGCLCLESNEIDELEDYPVSMLVEELSAVKEDTGVYFYDDDSKEYYGIYCDECRLDDKGDVWINVR